MRYAITILYLHEDPNFQDLIAHKLDEAHIICHIDRVTTKREYIDALSKKSYDIILTDYETSTIHGLEALQLASEKAPQTPFIMLLGNAEPNQALPQKGPSAYIIKSNTDMLTSVILKQLELSAQQSIHEDDYYQKVFNTTTVAIWESDFSYALTQLNDIKQSGITNLAEYWQEHQHFMDNLLAHTPVVNLNIEAIKLFAADNKENLMGSLYQYINHYKELFKQIILALFNNQNVFESEANIINMRGKQIDIVLSIVFPQQQEDYTKVITSAMNITVFKNVERNLRKLACYDNLTQLPNRLLFQENLAKALTRAKRHRDKLALLFIDLDYFKDINDHFGHSIGDALLFEVARKLEICSRATDSVARLGGDEFTIILEDITNAREVAQVAERIIDVITQPIPIDHHTINITISIGIAIYPHAGKTAKELMQHADHAMYRRKKEGRCGYQFFTQQLNTELTRVMKLESYLHHAIENNELSLHYQPKIDLKQGGIRGFEALLRWHHPELGAIEPEQFIPVLESSDLIFTIGEWVIYQVCTQLQQWNQQYPKWRHYFSIAINISNAQLMQEELISIFEKAFSKTKTNPQQLQLEVTESVVMRDPISTIKKLNTLKSLGIQLCLDDFGTGYSSLIKLKNIPFDFLKIDKSFVKDVVSNKNDANIIMATINLAHSLDLLVVAEGIETQQQLSCLKTLNCDQGQGYLFSKPLDTNAVIEYLKKVTS